MDTGFLTYLSTRLGTPIPPVCVSAVEAAYDDAVSPTPNAVVTGLDWRLYHDNLYLAVTLSRVAERGKAIVSVWRKSSPRVGELMDLATTAGKGDIMGTLVAIRIDGANYIWEEWMQVARRIPHICAMFALGLAAGVAFRAMLRYRV